jgi:hypothetical protein
MKSWCNWTLLLLARVQLECTFQEILEERFMGSRIHFPTIDTLGSALNQIRFLLTCHHRNFVAYNIIVPISNWTD